ncbi:MAG: hypothetical protein AABM41_09245 [Chloroflexota bacterium]
MDLNVVLPLLSSVLSFGFAAMVADQWIRRRQPYQLVWTIGLLWFGIAAGAEFLGGAMGWNEALYRIWYVVGAVWVAGWLGLGTAYLLAKTRFGYAVAISILLAGLFTFLTDQRYHYPDSGSAPLIYFLVGLAVASGVVVLTILRDERWAHLAALVIVGGTAVSAVMMATVQLPAPGFAVDPITGIPTGELFPGYLRLLTPFFNITGAFLLVLGALYSAYIFMPKRRVIRYSLDTAQGPARFGASLLIAPIAIVVNVVASVPGMIVALLAGRLSSRVPATILIAIGGLIPAITDGLNRFGTTSAFLLGQLLGIAFLFVGFLASIEVFSDIRLPFTRIVLVRRDLASLPDAVDSPSG